MKVESDKWMFAEVEELCFPQSVTPGEIDLRVLLQDEVWVTAQGQVLQLEDMEREHLVNVLGMLFNQAEMYQASVLEWYAAGMLLFMEGLAVASEEQRMKFVQEAHACIEVVPHVWLARCPLVLKLDALLG